MHIPKTTKPLSMIRISYIITVSNPCNDYLVLKGNKLTDIQEYYSPVTFQKLELLPMIPISHGITSPTVVMTA